MNVNMQRGMDVAKSLVIKAAPPVRSTLKQGLGYALFSAGFALGAVKTVVNELRSK